MFVRYVLASLLARKLLSGIALLVVGAVVGSCVVALGCLEGLKTALTVGGHPNNLVVLSEGTLELDESKISKEALAQLKILPGIAEESGQTMLSPEISGAVELELEDGSVEDLPFRGIDPIGYIVHDAVHVEEGRLPDERGREVMIGRQAAATFPALALGKTVTLAKTEWKIVGIFSAKRSILEREIWGNRATASVDLESNGNLYVVVRASSPQALDSLIPAIAQNHQLRLTVMGEQAFNLRSVGDVDLTMRFVALIIGVLVLGALFAVTNMLLASFTTRSREFAALWVVGYRRVRLLLLVFQESFLLGLVGALLGILVAFAVTHLNLSQYISATVNFEIPFGPVQVGEALVFGIVIALMSGLYPAKQLWANRFVHDL